ncbi:MAG: NAD(P)-binding domain-containing protein [Myxococcales bacterium]|nr:NAD(P)-binding domain-containing protein [Myxococcales bacterium]
MQIAILGTGMVGRALGSRLAGLGHTVVMGSRQAGNPAGTAWAESAGPAASAGTFADAVAGADLVILATKGEHAQAVLGMVGADLLAGKVVADLTNPLDFSQGMPPSLFISNTDSLAERLQRAFPEARFVKTLNTLNADLMVDPGRLPEPTAVFLSGDDAAAKALVRGMLESFGWAQIVDLGGLSTARGTESWLPLWIRLWGALGTASFNLRIVREGDA